MDLDFWRDISIIWLALQLFVILILPLAATYFAVRGMNIALRKLPPLFHTAQEYSHKARSTTESVAEKVVEPVIEVNKRATAAEVALRRLFQDRKQSTHSREERV